DLAAGDGVYTAEWTPQAIGNYTLMFPGGDVVQVSVLQAYGAVTQATSSYQTISGTNLNLGDDDVAKISPPFPIQFGGGAFSQLFVSSNGTISFTNAFSEYLNLSLPLPADLFASNKDLPLLTLVAPFWDDLYPVKGTNQNVFWAVTGATPNRELIVEGRDVRGFECRTDTAATVKFQVVFKEGGSDILFNYADTAFGGLCAFQDHGASATVGVQTSPGTGSTSSMDAQDIADGTSLLWQSPPPNPAASPLPTLTSLSPSSLVIGGPDFVLTLSGTNFVPGSRVQWNG